MSVPAVSNAVRKAVLSALFLYALGAPGVSLAAKGAGKHSTRAQPDVVAKFSDLAQQRPWKCKEQTAFDAPEEWRGESAQCAWQNRLRMRRWVGPGGEAPTACVSVQARWWTWARGTGGASTRHPAAWQGPWKTQSMIDNSGPQKRIVILQRLDDGQWSTTEWRWDPSPRAATRRWQEGRWAKLEARAVQMRSAPAEGGSGEMGKLRSVVLANVGSRVAEIGGDILNYQSDGLCLQIDAASPGQQMLQVPFAVEDSRLEQRAAMQLQLARRFPKANWLTPFSLMPLPQNTRGGAKFYAVWIENSAVKGQLWIPTKGDGALVRARITTVLPHTGPLQPEAPAVAAARRVIERELTGLAVRWAHQHE